MLPEVAERQREKRRDRRNRIITGTIFIILIMVARYCEKNECFLTDDKIKRVAPKEEFLYSPDAQRERDRREFLSKGSAVGAAAAAAAARAVTLQAERAWPEPPKPPFERAKFLYKPDSRQEIERERKRLEKLLEDLQRKPSEWRTGGSPVVIPNSYLTGSSVTLQYEPEWEWENGLLDELDELDELDDLRLFTLTPDQKRQYYSQPHPFLKPATLTADQERMFQSLGLQPYRKFLNPE